MSAKKVTVLLDNQTVDETKGEVTTLNGSKEFNLSVEWGAGSSAGAVAVETAPYKGYTGTWVTQTTFTWAAAEKIDEWRGTGPFGAIRARIETAITTSNRGVTATLQEN